MPLISVVICTHNRSRDLAECIAALSVQQSADFEYIVVDSASRPEEAAEIARIVGAQRGFRLLRLDEPGLSLARNAALQLVSGEWLALLDDDATPAPNWAEEALRLAAILPANCGALGGYVRPVVAEGLAEPQGKRWRQLISAVEYPGEGDCTDDLHVVAANLWFRADALREVGGFPTNLGRIGASLLSGEDKLVVGELIERGWRIWYSEHLRVRHKIHDERVERPWVIKRAYWDGISDRRIQKMLAEKVGLAKVAVVGLKFLALSLLYFASSIQDEYFLRFWYDLGWLVENFSGIQVASLENGTTRSPVRAEAQTVDLARATTQLHGGLNQQ